MSSLDEYLKQRKTFILVAGIALLVGAILKGFVLIIMVAAGLVYLVLKKKGVRKSEDAKDAESQSDEDG